MQILETERLVLRQLDANDAAFILRLVNEPSWLRYIGDKGVTTLEDAENSLALNRVLAITTPDNAASCTLLEKLGFALERLVQLSPDDDGLRLYSLTL